MKYEVLSTLVENELGNTKIKSNFFNKEDLINDLYIVLSESERELEVEEIKIKYCF